MNSLMPSWVPNVAIVPFMHVMFGNLINQNADSALL